MAWFDWLPFVAAHRRRKEQAAQAARELRQALEEAHVRELDLRQVTETMRVTREEFKKARRDAETSRGAEKSTMTGT